MSGLLDSGAGVETADFSGFADGGGGDVVYADTPADAGGYGQLATQGMGMISWRRRRRGGMVVGRRQWGLWI